MVVMEQFDLGKALKSIEEYKATRLYVAAPVVVAMATVVAGAAFDLSSLQVVLYSGSSVAAKFLTMFHDRFPWVKLLHVSILLRTSRSPLLLLTFLQYGN